MIKRSIPQLAAGLALVSLTIAPAAAPRPPALAGSYRLTLTSDWPQAGEAERCGNGGDEVVEGTLNRIGADRYRGTFTRRTRLLFCGVHGSSDAACALVLRGEGRVAVTGTVFEDERSPSGWVLRLAWTPEPGHAARTEGACAPGFKHKLEAMYLSVRHGVEFALPRAGAARSTERPDGYAWTVAIE